MNATVTPLNRRRQHAELDAMAIVYAALPDDGRGGAQWAADLTAHLSNVVIDVIVTRPTRGYIILTPVARASSSAGHEAAARIVADPSRFGLDAASATRLAPRDADQP